MAFVFGTVVGSFLNVCVYRLPKGESIVFPGSHCGACKKPVRGYDNIPVLSYFILKGRCRDCGTKFSFQYAAVEIFTGALFVLFYRAFGWTPAFGVYLFFTLAIVVESLIDFAHKIIPDSITLPGIVLGLILAAVFPWMHPDFARMGWVPAWASLLDSFAGILVGGGILYLVAVVAEKILKKEAMGGGDIKLLAMIGAFLGVRGAAWSLFAGSMIGSLAGIYFRLVKSEEEIPFGPFLGFAAILYIFVGNQAMDWYFHMIQSSLYR